MSDAGPLFTGVPLEQERRSKLKQRLSEMKLSAPLPNPQLRILNLGGGVQSCALAMMSARGELERLDYAIFADTGWEKAATYRYLDWLEERLPFPVLRVRRRGKDLGEYLIESTRLPETGRQHAPFFLSPDGMLSKQCSKEFKTRVIQATLRELIGLKPGQRGPKHPVVEQWLGMTNDELQRVSVSEKRYLHHRYPLIELRLNEADLYPWYEQRQLPIPPKSSCIFCPLQGPPGFARVMESEDRPRLVQFDHAIRPGHLGLVGEAFLTYHRLPIEQVDLRTAEQRGQAAFGDELLRTSFGDYCGDGNCGV